MCDQCSRHRVPTASPRLVPFGVIVAIWIIVQVISLLALLTALYISLSAVR